MSKVGKALIAGVMIVARRVYASRRIQGSEVLRYVREHVEPRTDGGAASVAPFPCVPVAYLKTAFAACSANRERIKIGKLSGGDTLVKYNSHRLHQTNQRQPRPARTSAIALAYL